MAIPTTAKNRSGPQRLKFPPCLPKLEPLPKRFFSRINPGIPICAGHLRISRMKHIFSRIMIKMQKDHQHFRVEIRHIL
jgi:hypothetical protein